MSYKKYTPQVVAPTQKPQPKPAQKSAAKPETTRQEIDSYLKVLTQMVEKDPQKAAEVFKGWLDRPSKIVKPKRAA